MRAPGIREARKSEPLGFSTGADFVRGVQLLPAYGFSFDLCIFHTQLGDVLRLHVPGQRAWSPK